MSVHLGEFEQQNFVQHFYGSLYRRAKAISEFNYAFCRN